MKKMKKSGTGKHRQYAKGAVRTVTPKRKETKHRKLEEAKLALHEHEEAVGDWSKSR